MRLIELAGDQLAAFASGMLDVIFTFAVVLERKAADARRDRRNAARRAGSGRRAGTGPARRARRRRRPDAQRVRSARAGVQVRDRWRVIDGGNPAETENGAGRQP
jgi:hypothetical protein